MKSEVFTAVMMLVLVFYVLQSCKLVGRYQCSGIFSGEKGAGTLKHNWFKLLWRGGDLILDYFSYVLQLLHYFNEIIIPKLKVKNFVLKKVLEQSSGRKKTLPMFGETCYLHLQGQKRRQYIYIPSKCLCLLTRPHSIAYQKTNTNTFLLFTEVSCILFNLIF
jgi:hypothetical protein